MVLINSSNLGPCLQAVYKGVKIDPWAVAVFDSRVNDGDRLEPSGWNAATAEDW